MSGLARNGLVVAALLLSGCKVGTALIGSACSEKTECASGFCLQENRYGAPTGFPGGTCTAACDDSACVDGAKCVALAAGKLCMAACTGGCRGGWVCQAAIGACVPDCRGGPPCPTGQTCGTDGVCGDGTLVAGSPTGAELGAACDGDNACTSGFCIEAFDASNGGAATGWIDGLCTAQCSATAACAASSTCVTLADGGYCLPACGPEGGTCRQGYVCNATVGACMPDCRQGFSCGGTLVCGPEGRCVDKQVGPPPTNRPVGAPCANPMECAQGQCLMGTPIGSPFTGGWPGGYCAAPCESAPCPEGSACVAMGVRRMCLVGCGATCRAGYACDGHLNVCMPLCGNGQCPPGLACTPQGSCAPLQGPPPPGPPGTADAGGPPPPM